MKIKCKKYGTWTTAHEIEFLNKLGTYKFNTENISSMPRKELLKNYIKSIKGVLVRDFSGLRVANREEWGDIDKHEVLKVAEKMLY